MSPQKRRPLIITMNNYDPNYIILLLLPALNLDTFAFVLSSLPITSSLVFIHHKLYCLITSYFIAPLQTFCFIITTLLFPKHTLCISARNHISCPSDALPCSLPKIIFLFSQIVLKSPQTTPPSWIFSPSYYLSVTNSSVRLW